MSVNLNPLLTVPQDVMRWCAERERAVRIAQGLTQKELARRVGVSEGTIKRFEKTGEAQFRTVLDIALVLGRLQDFAAAFKAPEVPASLYHRPQSERPAPPRRRARKKCN